MSSTRSNPGSYWDHSQCGWHRFTPVPKNPALAGPAPAPEPADPATAGTPAPMAEQVRAG